MQTTLPPFIFFFSSHLTKIITGRGKRTSYSTALGEAAPRQGPPLVRDSVLRCLDQVVAVRRAPRNLGLLLVPAVEMERLVRTPGAAEAIYSAESLARWLVTPNRSPAAAEGGANGLLED